MPLIRVETTCPLSDEQSDALCETLTDKIGEITGKRKRFTMVTVSTCRGLFGGEPGPAAFLDVRCIGGIHDTQNIRLSEALCSIVEDQVGIPGERIFLHFTSMKGYNWGWNGQVFAR